MTSDSPQLEGQEPRGGRTIRVLLADDHAILRESLRILLSNRADITIAGECNDGREAADEAVRLLPDVVLMDLNMPNLNGIEATREIRNKAPGVRVLLLSSYGNQGNVRDAVRAGAAGFVIKRSDIDELIQALNVVRSGEMYFSAELRQSFDVDKIVAEAQDSTALGGRDLLTIRELEIVQLVCEGHSAKEIGDRLAISPKTVEAHKANVMTKAGAKNRVELFRFALEFGIVGVNRPEDETGV